MTTNPNPNHHSSIMSLFFFFFFFLLLSLPYPSHQQQYHHLPSPSDLYNPRLLKAYIALQAWKHTMTCDPSDFTSNWEGPDVCNYNGVFCAPAPGDPHARTVASIDLNHAGICGTLTDHLGLLTDLAVFHINSNKFSGTIPESFRELKLLYELDVSNNHFCGPFPSVALHLPSLKYFDIRYNEFYGDVPQTLFDAQFDGIFINNNNFTFTIPDNIGSSPVSVLVLANLGIRGSLPKSISNMSSTLYELLLLNNNLSSCLPEDLGMLDELTVLDISSNGFAGPLPESIGKLKNLEQLNVAHNMLSGFIPESICELPHLQNFTFSDNFFCHEPENCLSGITTDDRQNCIPYRPFQRSEEQCLAFAAQPVHCPAYESFPTPPMPYLWSPPPYRP